MKNSLFFVFVLLLQVLFNGCGNSRVQNPGVAAENPGKYLLVKNWPQLPPGYLLGNPTGLGIDRDQNIFVFHRAGRKWPNLLMPQTFIPAKTIILLDRHTGKILNSWGDSFFIMPHGLTVDRDNNIWVTDVGLHQVFKFSHEGKLLMKLGEAKVAGNDHLHFNLPTDVAVAGDGSFYVSDGYGNSRVIKFSSSGQYLMQFGKKGSRHAEFDIPHAIDLDKNGNIYVADRENSRVQSFDSEGIFLKQWKKEDFGKIYSVTVDKIKNNLIAIDYRTNYTIPQGSDIMLFDSMENQLGRFGRTSFYEGPVCRYHDVAIDNEESIYVGDILGNTIQKFTKQIR